MKKTAIIAFATALSTLLLVGCSSTISPEYGSTHQSVEAHKDDKKITRHAIKKAGEKAGWRMTEFRGNALIAEKGDEIVTVEFSHGSFHTTPKNSSLESAINDALENMTEH